MCFNEQSSLLTYIIGLAGSFQLYNVNLIPESIFCGWVSQMQLIDLILWKNQPCKISESNKVCKPEELKLCNKTNRTTTTAGMIINHLEPFVLFMSIILFSKQKLPNWVLMLVIFFFICLGIYTKDTIDKKNSIEKECTYVTDRSDPHLYWQWNYNQPIAIFIYPFFLLIFIILAYYGFSDGKFSSIVMLISYILSMLIYNDKRAAGNIWCYFGAFLPWILYGYAINK